MNVVFIGSSGHVNYAFEAVKADPSLVVTGVAPGPTGGESAGRLQEMAAQVGQTPAVFSDYRRMLDELTPDVAVVAPWFCDNAAVAAEALRRGVAAYVEKPLSTTWEGLAALADAQEKTGAALTGMFGIRYEPWFLAAHQAAREGLLGDIRLLQGQKSYKMGTRGPLYLARETYGGTIPWVACHAVDWVRWLSGREFVSVAASHSTAANGGNGDMEATSAMLFTLTDGVIATVTADYLRPAAAARHDDDRVRVTGTAGTLEVVNRQVIYEPFAGERRTLPQPPAGQPFLDFVGSLRGGAPCLVSAKDALAVTAAVLKARDAADAGATLRF